MNGEAEAEIAALLGAQFRQTVEVVRDDLLAAFVATPDAFVTFVDVEGVALALGFSTFETAIA